MIELFEQNLRTENRNSSKGNQLKWRHGDIWYKADYAGYEGLAEYMVSGLLYYSNLRPEEYVVYKTETIRYRHQIFNGCKSPNFLPSGNQFLTLERLFHQAYGESLYVLTFKISDVKERLSFLVEMAERLTGLSNLGSYFSKLLTLDALFLNEDRHLHNIAFLLDGKENYSPSPIFDNGASLLSDLQMDYPADGDLYEMIDSVKAKTVSGSFEEQLDAAESLYGQNLHFTFGEKEISELLEKDPVYDAQIKNRVLRILLEQRRKYSYLFR